MPKLSEVDIGGYFGLKDFDDDTEITATISAMNKEHFPRGQNGPEDKYVLSFAEFAKKIPLNKTRYADLQNIVGKDKELVGTRVVLYKGDAYGQASLRFKEAE